MFNNRNLYSAFSAEYFFLKPSNENLSVWKVEWL